MQSTNMAHKSPNTGCNRVSYEAIDIPGSIAQAKEFVFECIFRNLADELFVEMS